MFFAAKYFPEEFVLKIIFTYIENAVANEKASLRAAGTTNPHARNSRLWYQWNINKALADRAATKDQAIKKKLTDQINKDVGVLVDALSDYIDQEDKIAIALYLGALNAGINPTNLPPSLNLDAWKRLRSAYLLFTKITDPGKQNEFETKDEFEKRASEAGKLYKVIMSVEINLPAKLTLGEYNVEGGYFSFGVEFPSLEYDVDWRTRKKLVEVADLNRADIRYYINRRNAPFFKEKVFPTGRQGLSFRPGNPRYTV